MDKWTDLDDLWLRLQDPATAPETITRHEAKRLLTRLTRMDQLIDCYGDVLDAVVQLLDVHQRFSDPIFHQAALQLLAGRLNEATMMSARIRCEVEIDRCSDAVENGPRRYKPPAA